MAVDPLSFDFGSDKPFYVYLYRDPRPRKRLQPIYVGKGLAKARRADVHWERVAQNPILRAILSKVRTAGLEPVVEIVGWFDEEAEAFRVEAALIARFGRRDRDDGPLANMTDGGDGASGRILSAESIERSRRGSIGTRRSEETKAKMRARWTPERRAQHSARRKNVPQSEEAKAKQSAAMRGRKRHPDAIRATADKLRGRTLSAEMRRKVGDGIARAWTPERRAEQARRMSEARRSGLILGRGESPHMNTKIAGEAS